MNISFEVTEIMVDENPFSWKQKNEVDYQLFEKDRIAEEWAGEVTIKIQNDDDPEDCYVDKNDLKITSVYAWDKNGERLVMVRSPEQTKLGDETDQKILENVLDELRKKVDTDFSDEELNELAREEVYNHLEFLKDDADNHRLMIRLGK